VGIETEYGRRGTLVHEVLADLHRRLFDTGESTSAETASTDGSAIVDLFHQLLQQRLGKRPEDSALQRALGEIEERLLREWGSAYGGQWENYLASLPAGCDRPPLPARFETSFGRAARGRETEFPALEIGSGNDMVRIGGRIDRIDVGKSGGQTVFAVIDYKTGSQRSDRLEDVKAGLSLQLALYTLAVTRLQIAGPEAIPLQMGYWHIRVQGFSPAIRQRKRGEGPLEPLEAEVWEALVDTLNTALPKLAAAMRSAKFPVFNADRFCTGRCPYRTVCRVSQIRALPEGLGKTWSV
jgi:hypothetical protein